MLTELYLSQVWIKVREQLLNQEDAQVSYTVSQTLDIRVWSPISDLIGMQVEGRIETQLNKDIKNAY